MTFDQLRHIYYEYIPITILSQANKIFHLFKQVLFGLPDLDSNQDKRIQSPLSYH